MRRSLELPIPEECLDYQFPSIAKGEGRRLMTHRRHGKESRREKEGARWRVEEDEASELIRTKLEEVMFFRSVTSPPRHFKNSEHGNSRATSRNMENISNKGKSDACGQQKREGRE